MIDFNNGEERLNKYSGSEVKTTLIYENEIYMIKYPDPIRDKKNILSYMNNQFSEHIGCGIFNACGFNAQETVMGYHRDVNGKKKIVVGCKDFTQDGSVLYEFSKIINQVLTEGKPGTTIESVHDVINRSKLITDKEGIKAMFWDMFVVDALIGNPDRHFDNWGIVEKNKEITFAPIYDCGSSLAALIDDKVMNDLLTDRIAFKNQEYNSTSCYYIDNKRIFYHEIFKNPPMQLKEAIKRIVNRINMTKIHDVIDSTPIISNIRKDYIKQALNLRYSQILTPALKRIIRQEKGSEITMKDRISHAQAEASKRNASRSKNTTGYLKKNEHEV